MRWPSIPLRIAVTVPFVVGVSLASGITAWIYWRHEQVIEQQLTVELQARVRHLITNELNDYLATPHLINALNADAVRLGQLPAFTTSETTFWERYFGQQLQRFPGVTTIAVGNFRGGMIGADRHEQSIRFLRTDDFAAGRYVATRGGSPDKGIPAEVMTTNFDARLQPWYQTAVAAGQATWSPVYPLMTDRPMLGIVAGLPIHNGQGIVQGVFTTALDLSHTHQLLASMMAKTSLDSVWLMEPSGLLVATSSSEPLFAQPVLTDPTRWQRIPVLESRDPLTHALAQSIWQQVKDWQQVREPQILRVTLPAMTYDVSLFPIRDPYGLDWLAVAASPHSSSTTFTGIWLFLISGTSVLGVIVLGTMTTRSICRPIRQFNSIAQSLASGEGSPPIPVTIGITEFDQMAASFHQLVDGLSRSFKKITDTTSHIIYIYDLETQTDLYVNRRVRDILGFSEEEIRQPEMTFLERLHQEDRERVRHHHERLKQADDDQILEVEYRERHADGTYRWFHTCDVVFSRNQKGVPRQILRTATDITQSKQLQEELAFSENRFRSLVSDLQVGVILQGSQAENLYTNTAALDLLGLTEDQLLGKSSFDPNWNVIHEDGSPFPAHDHPGPKALATGQSIRNVVMGVYRPLYQDWVWLLVNAEPQHWVDGQITQVICSFTDITARQQAELMLQERDHVLSELVKTRTDQLEQALALEALLQRITNRIRISLDEQTILQTVAEELLIALDLERCNLGFYNAEQTRSVIQYESTRELTSQLGREFLFDHFPVEFQQLKQGRSFQYCLLKNTESLDPFPRLKLGCPIMDDQGVWADIFCIRKEQVPFTDYEINFVSQIAAQCAIAVRQARLYQTAQAQVKALEHLNFLKDDFVSTVSHELRTPLTTINLAIRLLKMSQTSFPLHPKQQQYLQMLEVESQREIALINDLLDLQRMEAFGSELHLESLTLSEWLPGLLDGVRERCQQRELRLSVAYAPDLPALVTDAALLARAIRELLTNACKYTPPGEEIQVSVQEERDPASLPYFVVRITNTGVTIPQELLPRLFDKFYRIPSQDRWKQGGTGLGLALVRQFMAVLGGYCWVLSQPQSVSFFLILPCVAPTERQDTAPPTP